MGKTPNYEQMLPLTLSAAYIQVLKAEARKHPDRPGIVAEWNLGMLYRFGFAHVMGGSDARDARNAVEAGIRAALDHIQSMSPEERAAFEARGEHLRFRNNAEGA